MGAEFEFFGNWVRVSIIFGGVKSHGGVEVNRSEAVEFVSAIKRDFKDVAEAVIFNC